jgi:hypothetical protein
LQNNTTNTPNCFWKGQLSSVYSRGVTFANNIVYNGDKPVLNVAYNSATRGILEVGTNDASLAGIANLNASPNHWCNNRSDDGSGNLSAFGDTSSGTYAFDGTTASGACANSGFGSSAMLVNPAPVSPNAHLAAGSPAIGASTSSYTFVDPNGSYNALPATNLDGFVSTNIGAY